jgi:hypothetical protein
MKFEYKTTSAEWNPQHEDSVCRATFTVEECIPDPIVPDGDGWQECGFSATRNRLFWQWKRPINEQ